MACRSGLLGGKDEKGGLFGDRNEDLSEQSGAVHVKRNVRADRTVWRESGSELWGKARA